MHDPKDSKSLLANGGDLITAASEDGIDRRNFLKCMAWVGTGVLFTVSGGVLKSQMLAPGSAAAGQGANSMRGMAGMADMETPTLSFVQISDSHIGFDKPANHDVLGTLREAIARINAIHPEPSFIIHTGDLSHLSKPEEFDTLDQILKSAGPKEIFFVPGEHDVLGDQGKLFRQRYGKQTKGNGWYSFDQKGVHFIGLVNVLDLKAGGLGYLGAEQLAWLKDDLSGKSASTPIVVFAHVPLWSVYPQWGWGTDDSAEALGYLKRFGSVTVLNGHIHQTMQKVEGNITFHTAFSTAFPQPAPGSAPAPGPMTVPAEKLRSMLGMTSVKYTEGKHQLAIIDSALQSSDGAAGASTAASATTATTTTTTTKSASAAATTAQITIDNFTFTPATLTIKAGTTVEWINHDDMPHAIASSDKKFPPSPAIDTDQKYSHRFDTPGTYPYFCSIHATMTGKIVVQ